LRGFFMIIEILRLLVIGGRKGKGDSRLFT